MSRPRKGGVPATWRDALGDSALDSTAKLVGYAISTWMNGRGTCYPSRSSIAKRCSVTDRAVDGAVRRLEAGGLLEVQHRKGGNPETGTNFYRATLPEGANEVRRSEWPGANLTTARGEPDDARGERRSPESFKKASESNVADADAPNGASSAPEEECYGCHEIVRLAAPDFVHCAHCLAEAAVKKAAG